MKRINYLMLTCLLLSGTCFAEDGVHTRSGASTSPKKLADASASEVTEAVPAASSSAASAAAPSSDVDSAVETVGAPVVDAPVADAPVVRVSAASDKVDDEEVVETTRQIRDRSETETEEDRMELEEEAGAPLAKVSRRTVIVSVPGAPRMVILLDRATRENLERVVAGLISAHDLKTPEQREDVARDLERRVVEVGQDLAGQEPAAGSSSVALVPFVEGGPVVEYQPNGRNPHTPSRYNPSRFERIKGFVVTHLRSAGDLFSSSARRCISAGSSACGALRSVWLRFAVYAGLAEGLTQAIVATNNATGGVEWHIGQLDRAAWHIRENVSAGVVVAGASVEVLYASIRYICARLRAQPQ